MVQQTVVIHTVKQLVLAYTVYVSILKLNDNISQYWRKVGIEKDHYGYILGTTQ